MTEKKTNKDKRVPKNTPKLKVELSEEQKKLVDLFYKYDVIFCHGDFGSGKTMSAVHTALTYFNKRQCENIWITRPMLATQLAALPGSLEEKMAPYTFPIIQNLEVCQGKEKTDKMLKEGVIKIMPIEVAKGVSFMESVVIVDECIPKNYNVITNNGKINITKLKKNDLILTYNEITGENEYKPLVRAWSNGIKKVDRFNFSKKSYFECTDNHRVYTHDGVKYAKDLSIGDIVLTNATKQPKNILNEDQYDLMIGSILGDGHLQKISNNTARLCFTHGIKQSEYLIWKMDILNGSYNFIEENGYSKKPAILGKTKSFIYKNNNEHKIQAIDKINLKSLAIMIMDDGYVYKDNSVRLYSTANSLEQTEKLSQKLNNIGYKNSYRETVNGNGNKYYEIRIYKNDSEKLLKDTSKYFHESMSYKNPFFNKEDIYKWNNKSNVGDIIVSIDKDYREDEVWDIEVEDNHNFYITKNTNKGFLVHNCQDMTYADFRTILTRLGKGSKIIFCGSKEQIDYRFLKSSCIFKAMTLENSGLVGYVTLKGNHRNPILTDIINYLEKDDKD